MVISCCKEVSLITGKDDNQEQTSAYWSVLSMDLQIGFNEIETDALENNSMEAVWTYYNRQDNHHYIVPDGRTDIIFTFHVHTNGAISNIIPLISPPFTQAHCIKAGAHQGFIGFRLKAGAASPFLKCPLAQISGSLQYGQHAVAQIPWLKQVGSSKRNMAQLISTINPHICTNPRPAAASSIIADILSLMHEGQGGLPIKHIAQQIKLSERTLNRKFIGAIGLPPKQYSSIIRLRRAIKCLTNPDYAISSIAIDCGFADQAHMTREIKLYMGQTPTRLKTRLETEILL